MTLLPAYVTRFSATAAGAITSHMTSFVAIVTIGRKRSGIRGRRIGTIAGDVPHPFAGIALHGGIRPAAVAGDVADFAALVTPILVLLAIAGEMAESVALVALVAALHHAVHAVGAFRSVPVWAYAGEVSRPITTITGAGGAHDSPLQLAPIDVDKTVIQRGRGITKIMETFQSH